MVEGVFLKNGEITEVYLPNGLTQLICQDEGCTFISECDTAEIHAFTFLPRRVAKKKNKWKNAMLLLSLFSPMVVAVIDYYELLIGVPIMMLFMISWIWDSIVVYSNIRRSA